MDGPKISKYIKIKSCSVAQVIRDEVAVTVVLVPAGTSYFTDDRDGKGVLWGSKRKERNSRVHLRTTMRLLHYCRGTDLASPLDLVGKRVLSCTWGSFGKELSWFRSFYNSLPTSLCLCFNLCMPWRVRKGLNSTDLLSWYLSLALSSWGYPRSVFLNLWFMAVSIEENCSVLIYLFEYYV